MHNKQYRPPIVVVLGHVDHGKTTLLDYIRKTKKVEKEIGGITQSIGAYEVTLPLKDYHTNKITFIDTPGHEAFTTLRERGSQVADACVLVVDAVDSVMPQTIESIAHIKVLSLPCIVAINKIDLPGAQVERVKHDLATQGLISDTLGGTTPMLALSAKTGKGVDELLEAILILSSQKDIYYKSDHPPRACIIETHKGPQGVVVSSIMQDGILHLGDTIYAEDKKAKIKALISDTGTSLDEVVPSMPFMLVGFKDMPSIGSSLTHQPTSVKKLVRSPTSSPLTLQETLLQIPSSQKKLKLIVKTNSQGSMESLGVLLKKNPHIEIVLQTIGEIHKSDIFLAKATHALIVGFGVRPDQNMRELAKQEKVVIKTYELIYELVDELQEVSRLLQEQEKTEAHLKGEAKIIARFIIDKEQIAGVKITKGKLNVNDQIEIVRSDKTFGKTKIVSLKHRAKTIQEIKKNEEAGIIFYPQLDFIVGDVIKSYSI